MYRLQAVVQEAVVAVAAVAVVSNLLKLHQCSLPPHLVMEAVTRSTVIVVTITVVVIVVQIVIVSQVSSSYRAL